MIDKLLDYLAPHYCYGCGEIGAALCEHCKYNIEEDYSEACVGCGGMAASGLCGTCHLPYQRSWVVGEREGLLRRLIDEYKFESVRGVADTLAELLADRLPELPGDTIVVPVPTIRPHVRQRGFDHMVRIAKGVAGRKGCHYAALLARRTRTVQRGKGRAERIRQAKEAFSIKGLIPTDVPYLIVDDVTTTGATLQYAAQALCDAGAQRVWVAVLSRQPKI